MITRLEKSEIWKFLMTAPSWARTLSLFLIFFLLCLLGYVLWIHSEWQQVKYWYHENESLKIKFNQTQRAIENLPQKKQVLQNTQNDFNKKLSLLPSANQVPVLLENLTQLGERNNLVFKNIKLLEEVSHGAYMAFPIDIILTGFYPDFVKFISAIVSLAVIPEIEIKAVSENHSNQLLIHFILVFCVTPNKEGVEQNIMSLPGPFQTNMNTDVQNQGITVSNTAPVSSSNFNKLLSLDFQEVPVRQVLQSLAKFSGLNIVVSNAVNGNITLHLAGVRWQDALAVILQTQGLGKREMGDILFVAPESAILAQEKSELQVAQQIEDLASLQSRLIQIHYGKASDIAVLLTGKTISNAGGSSLLSDRASVSADSRTNTLWVQDTPHRLDEIQKLVQQLDIPVRQVEILARIVSVDTGYLDELGVRFGVTQTNHISGTLEGANALAGGTSTGDVPLAQRLNVDLPSANIGSPEGAASIGMALAKLGNGSLLDLELSALESEGVAQLISNPRLLTDDQQAAVIEAGQEIPFQQKTSSGATDISFKKAVLSLSVTPQITPDSKILLTLKVNQDRANYSRLVLGVPPIDTRQIQTQILADNGQTIVLGGIYEQTHSNKIERVPFLGSLPLVGKLFQHHLQTSTRSELLIFITPRIMG